MGKAIVKSVRMRLYSSMSKAELTGAWDLGAERGL